MLDDVRDQLFYAKQCLVSTNDISYSQSIKLTAIISTFLYQLINVDFAKRENQFNVQSSINSKTTSSNS